MATRALKPVKTTQVYEQVCVQMLDLITQGAWSPGDRLPSERELANRLKVSRPTIREAIAALNTHGIIATKAGAGSFVVETTTEALADLSARFVRPQELSSLYLPSSPDISPAALLEAREALEPAVCALAARCYRRSARLAECLEIMHRDLDVTNPEHRELWSQADREFHREFAIITGNPVFIGIANIIADAMDQKLWHQIRDDALQREGMIERHARQHFLIADAVMSGDPELSMLNARRHVVAVKENILEGGDS